MSAAPLKMNVVRSINGVGIVLAVILGVILAIPNTPDAPPGFADTQHFFYYLLPIPVLDGGHIVFSLWHGITRRKVNVKVQAVLINVCAVLLIGAMIILSFNDIDRKFQIKKFFGKLSGQTEQVKEK